MSDAMTTSTFRPGDRVRIEDDGTAEGKVTHFLEVGQTVTVDRVGWNADDGTTLAVSGEKWDSGATISQTVAARSVTLVGLDPAGRYAINPDAPKLRATGYPARAMLERAQEEGAPVELVPSPGQEAGVLDLDGEVWVRVVGNEDERPSYVLASALVLAEDEPAEDEREADRASAQGLVDELVEERDEARAELARAVSERDLLRTTLAEAQQNLDQARRPTAVEPTWGAMRTLLAGALPPGIDPVVADDGEDDDGDATLTLVFPGYRWDDGRLVPNVREYEVEVEVNVRATVSVTVEATDEDVAHDEAFEQVAYATLTVEAPYGDVDVNSYAVDSWDVGRIEEA